MNQCLEKLEALKQSKEIVRDYFIIFALDIIIRDLGKFMLNKWITIEIAEELKEVYNQLIKKAAKNA